MRYRITIRADDIELRGYIDGEETLRAVATAEEQLELRGAVW